MSGNVAEWCYDSWKSHEPESFGSGELENPIHYEGGWRSVRGGDLNPYIEHFCICVYRCSGEPYSRNSFIGGWTRIEAAAMGIRPARNAE